MSSSTSTLNIPNLSDFQEGGKFFRIKNLTLKADLPTNLMLHIFPDYDIFHKKIKISKKHLLNIKKYCIQLKHDAIAEDRRKIRESIKEIELKKFETKIITEMEDKVARKMEEKIREYFDNYYKNYYKSQLCNQCSCRK
jgi:hypothetical protein